MKRQCIISALFLSACTSESPAPDDGWAKEALIELEKAHATLHKAKDGTPEQQLGPASKAMGHLERSDQIQENARNSR